MHSNRCNLGQEWLHSQCFSLGKVLQVRGGFPQKRSNLHVVCGSLIDFKRMLLRDVQIFFCARTFSAGSKIESLSGVLHDMLSKSLCLYYARVALIQKKVTLIQKGYRSSVDPQRHNKLPSAKIFQVYLEFVLAFRHQLHR